MKPTPIKVKGQLIIIICIVILIFLGILWLIKNNNTLREGIMSSGGEPVDFLDKVVDTLDQTNKKVAETNNAQKKEFTASEAEKFYENIDNQVNTTANNLGINITGGKTLAENLKSVPETIVKVKSIIDKELDVNYDIIFNTDVMGVIDTTKSACDAENNFMYGEQFGDSLGPNYQGKVPDLNIKCSELIADTCNLTDNCVWVNGKKCMAGDADGPTLLVDKNGNDIDYAYYTYKNQCYGSCGVGGNYANPCSEFKDGDKGVNAKCIERMWKKTQCPNSRFVTSDVVNSLINYTKAGIKALFANAKDEDNYANCYGPNEDDWPKPCDKYPKNTSEQISVRCLSKLYKDSGCDQTEDVITKKFALDNVLNNRGEMIKEFDTYRAGVDANGIFDSDYRKCFGNNPSVWPEPCANTNDNSTGLSYRCLRRLFLETKCNDAGAKITITRDYALNNKFKTKKALKQTFNEIKSGYDTASFEKCYGPNKYLWPEQLWLIGIGTDNRLYFKRKVPGIFNIEESPWERTESSNVNMTSIVQLPENWFYGTGDDGLLYIKQYWSDDWQLDPLIYPAPRNWGDKRLGFAFSRVRLVYGKNLVGIGMDIRDTGTENGVLYMINRNPNNPSIVEVPNSCCCMDVIGTDEITKWGYFGFHVLSAYNRLYGRTELSEKWMVNGRFGRQVGYVDYHDDNPTFSAFINIPEGTVKEDGKTPTGRKKVLGIIKNGYGSDGLLMLIPKFSDYKTWTVVPQNNNIPMSNIAYVKITYKTVRPIPPMPVSRFIGSIFRFDLIDQRKPGGQGSY